MKPEELSSLIKEDMVRQALGRVVGRNAGFYGIVAPSAEMLERQRLSDRLNYNAGGWRLVGDLGMQLAVAGSEDDES